MRPTEMARARRRKGTEAREDKRGWVTQVAPDLRWLDELNLHPEVTMVPYKDLGRLLAEHVGAKKPFDDSQISRLLRGQGPVDVALVDAFCKYTGMALPVGVFASEQEARWAELGRELADLLPDLFRSQMRDLAGVLAAEKQKREAIQAATVRHKPSRDR